MAARFFPLSLILFFSTLVSPAHASLCSRVFQKISSGAQAVQEYLNKPTPEVAYDEATFIRAKAYFAEKLERGEEVSDHELRALGVSRTSIAMAFLEASADHAGTSHRSLRLTVQQEAAWHDRQQKALASLDFSKPLVWADMEAFIQRVYLTSNNPGENYPSLPSWLSSHLPTPPKEFLRQRLQEAIWREDLQSALNTLGITREPIWGVRIRNWVVEHPNLHEAIYTTGLDAFTGALIGLPVRVPDFQITRQITFSPELLKRAREHGFDAVYEDLRAQYGRSAKFDTAFQVGRMAVYRAAIVYIAYAITSTKEGVPYLLDPRYWLLQMHYSASAQGQIDDLQNRIANAENTRREQFLIFKRDYVARKGPFSADPPNPWDSDYATRCAKFPASYQQEADAKWLQLHQLTDDEIRAQFPHPGGT